MLLAISLFAATHIAVHFVIFAAYIAAVLRVPSTFKSLIYLRPVTLASGAGFFLFCGMTHLGLALEMERSTLFAITDHLQALSIVTFLITLSMDLAVALRRLRLAFKIIQETYGEDGDRMIATVTSALQGRPLREPKKVRAKR